MSNFLSNFDTEEQGQELSKSHGSLRSELDNGNEIDPNYKQKKKRQKLLIIILVIVLIAVCFGTYYQLSRMLIPDFQNKSITEVQKWAAKNKMEIDVKPKFSLDVEQNHVISQSEKANQKIKKGSPMTFTVSQGADPDEVVKLPEFSKMTEMETEEWLKKNQLPNLTLLTEYDEKISQGKFIREELDDEATRSNFKRGDNGKIIFSKGKEVYKKDIAVPDFSNKLQNEVESWAKKNELELDIKKIASNTIQSGQVVSQSIEAKEKIARKTKFTVEISAGKGILVPDFSRLTKETAQTQGNLQVTVEEQFSEEIPYGQLISQSVEQGKELTEADDLKVTVVYSAGKPYIKDLAGEIEGDLQKIFFEEFRSKGANINYVVNYVESDLAKGTVVGTDAYGTFLPLDYTVTVNVSLGS